jgi:hypothetical protein
LGRYLVNRMHDLNNFLMGGICIGYAMAALFFLRFWRRTRDRLFIMFAISFAILSAIRLALFAMGEVSEDHFIFWFRFAAYALILLAIIDKNRHQ